MFNQPWLVIGLCWIVSAGLAYLAVKLVDRAADDRLVGALAVVTGIVVAWDYAHAVQPLGLALVWAICTVLDVSVCTEMRTLRVPPLVVLPVTLFAIGTDIFSGNVSALILGGVIGAAFAFASLRSKGKATGLGDAQLAALAGLTLGLELGTIAVATACFAAAAIAFARKRSESVAFSPYLATTIQCGLLLAVIG